MKEKKKRAFSVTTKTGDEGETGLLDHTRVHKHDPRPEAYGAIDEANAFIGLARAKSDLQPVKEILLEAQNHLYVVNAELACRPESQHLLKTRLTAEQLRRIEERCEEIETKLKLPPRFVLYGQSEVSAELDVARAVLRRAERRIVELSRSAGLSNPLILAYVNRLSDLLFLLARYYESEHGIPFAHPLDG